MVVRTTVTLPDDTAEFLKSEARRRRQPASSIVREAVEKHLGICREVERELPFESLGVSRESNVSDRVDEILAAEWADAILRDH